jgi:hypothetical protein
MILKISTKEAIKNGVLDMANKPDSEIIKDAVKALEGKAKQQAYKEAEKKPKK